VDKQEWQEKGKGHRGRLRDRFQDRGIDSLSDAEVLELLLSFGTPRSDCKDQARAALERFGSFSSVLEASQHDLQQIQGIGPKNSFAIHFVQATARRYLKERLRGKRYLHSSEQVKEYLLHSMRGLKKEIFTVIFLDSSHAVIDSEILAEGTLANTTVYPREMIIKALHHNAAALIVAHNHPSGSLQPSQQDRYLTRALYLAAYFLDIRILDHLIIGDGFFSFADHGLMDQIREECHAMVKNGRISNTSSF
jgi:DNA repair protein RadC